MTRRINSAALGLGISSLVIGVLSLFPAIVPLLGAVVAIPTAGIALLLGVAGLIVSLADKRRSIGLPIAGMAVSAAALAITLGWMIFVAQAAAKFAEATQKAAREMRIREAEEASKRAQAESRRRAEEMEREIRRREEEKRKASIAAAARERERLARLEAERMAEAKREEERESTRRADLKAATEGLRAFEEGAKLRAKACRDDLANAEAEVAKQADAKKEAEADAERLMKKGGLSATDRQYVRGCIDGRLKHKPDADPAKLALDVTKRVKDGDAGVPRYPKRILDGTSFGSSSYVKIAQIVSEDEMVIYPGLVRIKGVATVGLTAGLKDGSRVELKDVTVVADGKGTYTNSKGVEESVPRLIVVDFKKVSPVMKSDTLKKWLAAGAEFAEAKASVALRAEAVRQDERMTEAEVARRMAEIAKLKGD